MENESGDWAEEEAELEAMRQEMGESEEDSQEETETADDSGSEEEKDSDSSDDAKSGGTEEETDTGKSDDSEDADAESVDKKTEDTTDSDPDPQADEKPPKGFVPHGALAEERALRQQFKAKFESLQLQHAEMASKLAAQSKKPDGDEFKVLSNDEYKELLTDDPDEAAMYQHRLINHQNTLREQADLERQSQEADHYRETVIQESLEECSQYASTPERAKELMEAGVKHGLDETMLTVLTTPGAKVTFTDGEGQEQSLLMGRGSAQVVKLLDSLANMNPEKIRQEILETETERITSEVTAQLMKKLKTSDSNVKTLDDGFSDAGGIETSIDADDMSDEEWLNLPEAKKRKLLGG